MRNVLVEMKEHKEYEEGTFLPQTIFQLNLLISSPSKLSFSMDFSFWNDVGMDPTVLSVTTALQSLEQELNGLQNSDLEKLQMDLSVYASSPPAVAHKRKTDP